MFLNEKGWEFLRAHEGFRAKSYRDVVGVWTVGYGHTGRAGPPEVTPDTTITEQEARALLKREAESFADAVRPLFKRKLNTDQFSALVSFAYNVGMKNFARSSVLKAVNAGDDAAVARRLALWIKAGGRVWPGLVRRRAAEAAMFLGTEGPTGIPDVPRGKSLLQSTTGLAATVSAVAGTLAALSASLREIAGIVTQPWVGPSSATLLVGAFLWILRERWRKSVDDGV